MKKTIALTVSLFLLAGTIVCLVGCDGKVGKTSVNVTTDQACPNCHGIGRYGTCLICARKDTAGRLACNPCSGTGTLLCGYCNGRGTVPSDALPAVRAKMEADARIAEADLKAQQERQERERIALENRLEQERINRERRQERERIEQQEREERRREQAQRQAEWSRVFDMIRVGMSRNEAVAFLERSLGDNVRKSYGIPNTISNNPLSQRYSWSSMGETPFLSIVIIIDRGVVISKEKRGF